MTPRYRTAFSVPSGFAASTPATTKPASSSAKGKGRKSGANARSVGKVGQDVKAAERESSAAA